MKKLLFTFLALMVLGTSAWGATTVTDSLKNMGWTQKTDHPSFSLSGGVISVSTDANQKSTNFNYNNGYYHNNGCWYVYQDSPNKGKFTVSAKSGYVIRALTLTYGTNNSGSLQDVATSSSVTSKTAYKNLNVDDVSFIVYNTSTTKDLAKISVFSVTYDKKVTSVAMDASMTVSVGNTFQIGQITPTDAYCVWSSSDNSKVAVDQNGIITANAVTSSPVTIKVKSGSFEKTCAVTVVEATGKSITETFSKAETSSTWQGQGKDPYSVNGDNDLLHWIMRSTRRATSDQVDGVQATRISYNSGTNYIAYNNSATYPAEGGVKRVSFKWVAASGSNPVVFDVDNTSAPLISHHTYLLANKSWTSTQTFTKDVNMAKNAQFRIKLMASGVSAVAATLNISPITITPYLLFTNKAVTASNGFYKYNDNDLINNTGENPTITVNDANAASVDEDGTVRSLQDGKTVTVTAKWGDVTTTTKLTTKLIDPAGSFALGAAVITKNIGDADFDNAFNKTVGDAFTYKSTNEDVATVDENGKVHIVNGGTTQIKAVFAASAPYKAKEFAYTLDVTHTPTEAYFEETFDSIPVPTSVPSGTVQTFAGKGGVYSWSMQNAKYGDSGEKVGGIYTVNLINNSSHFKLAAPTEGGIKEVAFQYKSKAGTKNPIHFYVKAGEKTVEMSRVGTGDVLSFAHQFNIADTVDFSIYQGPTDNPQQGHILVLPIKIVPYLLYTKKVVAASKEDGEYINNDLINNTGGTPSYSISCPEDVATINPTTGAVTIKKSDTVTVTAKLGQVSTTYTLQMYAKPIPEISFAEESLNKDLLAGKFTNQLTKPDGVGEISYSSNNEDIATVDANGEVTMHSIGDATITATIAESTTYAATSKSYTLTVGFTPAAGTYWTETFSNLPKTSSYVEKDTAIIGDGAVYNWNFCKYAYRESDWVGNKQYNGICKKEGGYIKTTNMEGGVKCVSFEWTPKNNTGAIDFSVKVGETPYEYTSDPRPANQIYQYARLAGAKQNANLEFKLENFVSTEVSAYIVLGKFTFVPYLLYTKKAETINLADYQSTTYTNDKLINNTDVTIQAGQTDIEFSVVGQSEETDKIATVNKETGAVTPVGGGTITVQAKWGEVTTTYELTINKMAFTPAFAQTEVDKTMNDSVFSIQLNNVPEDAGARTYSSANERVAKVNNEGVVTIYGPGTTDIKVEIAANAKYEKANAQFTLTITEPTTDTDITEGFLGKNWALTDTTLVGDLCNWKTYQTRRTTNNDSIVSKGVKMGAEWMQGETALGYLESDGAVEGGVKRIYFTWIKNAFKSPATGTPTFMVKVGDVEDVFDATNPTTGTYLHNFNIRENSVIKIYNNSATNFKAGPIVITPYIFYSVKNDTVMVTKGTYSQTLIDNTNGVGTITYESDNTTAAEVSPTGEVTLKAGAENPVTITAKWQPDPNVEKYVTTTYKLLISEKKQRGAEFAQPQVDVVRGATPENALDLKSPDGDSEPVINYESSNTEVAVIGENNAVITVGPGETTITAHIGETNKCLAQDVSYALTVTYTPAAGTYFTETFSNAVAANYKQGPDTITGSYGFYQWGLKRYRRNTTSDKVAGVQGTRICYDGTKSDAYIATIGAQEGGLKEVVFNYVVPGMANLPIHFFVQVGDSTHEYYHAPITSSTAVTPYAHVFGVKNNTTLSIRMNEEEATPQSALTVSPVKIIPYLLYTRKDTTVVVSEMASTNYKFFNNKWINNAEGTITYSVRAKDNAVVIDGDSVKIIGEGTDTIQASWEGVTTTYVIHTVLETPVLSFAETEVNKKVSESPYTQEVTLTTPATGTIVYSIVDDPAGASINSVTGEVTMTAAGVYTIKATFPQQLPYKQGEATYQLTVTEKTVPQISFTDANVDKDLLDAAFTNTLNAPEGVGAITYVSSNEDVATVDANGLVSMAKTTGSAIITAYSAESEEYAADSAKFTVNVTYTPVAGKVWKETFSKRNPTVSKSMDPVATVGDSTIYNWVLTNYDSNNTDMFDGILGLRLRYDGSMVNSAMEGGIKALAFDWRAANNSNPIHFTVKVGEESVVVNHAKVPKADPNRFSFARKYDLKSNASFSIKLDTAGQGTLAFVGYSYITVVPYLLFTATNHQVSLDLDQVQQFDLNMVLINNTGADATFAVDSFKTDVTPTINAGVLDFTNVKKGGKVYVSAKWEGVATTLVINTTITPEVNFAEPTPTAQNLADGSYTNALVAPEGVGAITYTSSSKQVATVDNEGKVTFLVAGSVKITAKVAASDSYKAAEKSYDLTINGYTPAEGEAWVETFSLMEKRDPYVTTEEGIAGDSLVYSWRANDYIRPNVKQPFRLHTNGYIKTDGNQEGGIKYVALNWIAAATGNIDFTMKVNNDSYQYKGGVTVNKAYRFEHFFNADSICPLEIKVGSQDITAYMSVVDVTVVPYLMYTKKNITIKDNETYKNTNLIDNTNGGTIKYTIVSGPATIDNDGTVHPTDSGTVKVKASWNDEKVYTTYTLKVMLSSTTFNENETNIAARVAKLKGQNLNITIERSFTANTYNTLCLPFNISKTDLETAFNRTITSLAEFTETAELDDAKKNLNIQIEETDNVVAGMPYLIQFEGDNVVNPVFNNVTIVETKGDTIEGETASFIGSIDPVLIGAGDKSVLFVVAGNKLAWNATGKDSYLKAFRAHFSVPGMTSQSGVAPRLVYRMPTTPTELMNINENSNANGKFILNNQLIIIRDGKMYNAQGQVIQ